MLKKYFMVGKWNIGKMLACNIEKGEDNLGSNKKRLLKNFKSRL